ncbi:hypothetical protein GCM10027159_27050 [Lysobacter terrae]
MVVTVARGLYSRPEHRGAGNAFRMEEAVNPYAAPTVAITPGLHDVLADILMVEA